MSEMVERVAEAIRAVNSDTIGLTYTELTTAMARAAIAAMREPTQAMIDACDLDIHTEGTIVGVWDDMIDEALK